MPGEWDLLATRPGGTVTSLVNAGGDVLAATPAGLRRSSDGGRSWTVLGGARAPGIELVVPSPAFTSDATVLAGTSDGLLRSVDGGGSWQQALVGSRVAAIAFSPTFLNDGLVLVGTEQDGILRSHDRGHTWKSANPGLLDLTALGLACSPAFEADHTVFAATASGIFRSPNAGRTWRAIETLPTEPAVQCIGVSPRFPRDPIVVAGTEAEGLLRSTDGGATWHSVEALFGRSVTALAWSGGSNLTAATDVGVMASDNGGETWWRVGPELGPVLSVAFASDGTLLAGMPRLGVARSSDLLSWEGGNAGLQASLVVALALSPEFRRDQTLYLAGLEDGVAVSTDAGTSWETSNGVLAGDTAVFGLAAGRNRVYAASSAGIFRKNGNTSEWELVHSAPSRAVRADGQRVVAVRMTDALMASSDSGGSWLPLAWPASAGQPKSMAMAGSSTVLVGTGLPSISEAAVWRSTDGQDFQRVLIERGEGVVALAASPTDTVDSTIFAGVGDAVLRSVQGVFERVHGERRPVWRRVTLPGTVSALETSPAYRRDRTLLAATTAGVCISHDAGVTFQTLGSGMGDPPVLAVAFSPAYAEDHLIYAVELGGRIWRHRDA